MTESGEKVGKSQIAAKQGISMVVMSRILMAAPGEVLVRVLGLGMGTFIEIVK